MCFAMNIPSDTATDYTMSITAPDKIGYFTIRQTLTVAGRLWGSEIKWQDR
jgi:hypothetical protein